MLEFFLAGDLPGVDPELVYPPRDVVSYEEIWRAAQLVSFGCAESRGDGGWGAIGKLLYLLFTFQSWTWGNAHMHHRRALSCLHFVALF